MHTKPSFALVTPSFKPDFERCRWLTASTEKYLKDSTRHFLIVDKRDLKLFRPLESSRVTVFVAEEILPWWIFRVPALRMGWLSLRTPPIRNWILQQLLKLSIVNTLDADVAVFCDSDVAFVRPFDLSILVRDEKTRLHRVGFQDKNTRRWSATSKLLLGIENKELPAVSYVGNLVAWRKDNVLKLHRRLEDVSGRHWIQAICRHWHVSEYCLYGIFVEHVLGLEEAGHYALGRQLIKPSWSASLSSEEKVDDFFGTLSSEQIGVMIHSRDSTVLTGYVRKKLEAP